MAISETKLVQHKHDNVPKYTVVVGPGIWTPALTCGTCGNCADPVTLSWSWGSHSHPDPSFETLDKNYWRCGGAGNFCVDIYVRKSFMYIQGHWRHPGMYINNLYTNPENRIQKITGK